MRLLKSTGAALLLLVVNDGTVWTRARNRSKAQVDKTVLLAERKHREHAHVSERHAPEQVGVTSTAQIIKQSLVSLPTSSLPPFHLTQTLPLHRKISSVPQPSGQA